MTNPTSNFGWQMPTSTDLVTDLPADFEVFGQAVDTDFADLLGGASGYILSKASATDLDFAWIPNDQGDITAVNVTAPITGGGTSGAVTIGVSAASTSAAGVVQLSDSTSTTSSVLASTPTATKLAYDLAAAAVPKSTVTTNGDLIYATGSSAVTRLGIGSTGQVLKVAGGVPSWGTDSGKVLQVVQASTSTGVTISSTTYTDTGVTASITPTLNTSKILVLLSQQVLLQSDQTAGYGVGAKILRGATTIVDNSSSSVGVHFIEAGNGANGRMGTRGYYSQNYLDSPATTSATTYKVQMAANTVAGSSTFITQGNACVSTIILMEIGA